MRSRWNFRSANLVALLLGLSFGLTVHSSARAKELTNAKPNIIFILVDDMGFGDLGVLFQNERAKAGEHSKPAESTPNLDQFAAEGAQLRHHYCPAPVCAPSRASLMLGVTQGHANVRDNQFDKALENNHTIATVLKQAGYQTVIIGKWGLQGHAKSEKNPNAWPAYPIKRGFDYFFGYVRHKDGHEHYPKEGLYDGPKQVWDGLSEISSDLDACYTTDLWTAKAKQWIANYRITNSVQPFFMYLAYDTPHAVQEYPAAAYPEGGGLKGGLQWLGKPHQMINTASGKPDSYVDPLYESATWDDDKDPATPEVPWPDVDKRYATSVRRIDHAVGDIVQLLKDLKIDTNTMVVFCSDNGPSDESYLPNEPLKPNFFASYGPFDGIKRDCWEGGLRVPALARWPGHIPAEKILTRPSALYDWLPTFAEAAGLPAPARADGVSLLPELTGKGGQRERGYDYVEYFFKGKTPKYKEFSPAHRGRERGQMQMIRMGDYLGLRYNIQSPKDAFEIYDVVRDPQETKNLAAQMGSLQLQMQAKILQVRRPDAEAPRPYDNELLPPVTVAQTVEGLDWKAYEGDYPWVPNFEVLEPILTGVSTYPDLKNLSRSQNAGILYSGYLKIPVDGEYVFRLAADTGTVLRIHDATVIDADFGYETGRTITGGIELQAGLHPFRLSYARRQKGWNSLYLTWSGPGIECQLIPASVFRREVKPPLTPQH